VSNSEIFIKVSPPSEPSRTPSSLPAPNQRDDLNAITLEWVTVSARFGSYRSGAIARTLTNLFEV
jgi:hypothetical protein